MQVDCSKQTGVYYKSGRETVPVDEVKNMKKWFGKITAIFASAVLMMAMAVPAWATESVSSGNWPVDTEKTDCSISLKLTYKEADVEKKMTDGSISIYTVATVKVDNGYVFDTSTGKFAGSSTVAGIPSLNSDTLNQQNSDIAKALEKEAKSVSADKTAAILEGSASFTDLTPGLYLVIQETLSEGNRKINPFLISIPDAEGNYEIEAAPKNGYEIPPTPPTTPKTTVTPSTPKTPSGSSSPSGSKASLPQTGQLWWPVPVLCGIGLALIIGGSVLKRKKEA